MPDFLGFVLCAVACRLGQMPFIAQTPLRSAERVVDQQSAQP